MVHDAKRNKSLAYIKKLHARKNAVSTPCFNHILEQKELDGLSRGKPPVDNVGNILTESWEYDLNGDEGLIVEWSVPEEMRKEAIAEVATIIKGSSARITTDEEVVDADLPVVDH